MALYEQNRQQGDNVSEPQQEDVALESTNKKVDEKTIDKIVNMIHNNSKDMEDAESTPAIKKYIICLE